MVSAMRWTMLPLLLACSPPPAEKPADAPDACTKPGQQCRLKAGGLGVCTRHPVDQDRFECVPQH